jgi:hypothetical protein
MLQQARLLQKYRRTISASGIVSGTEHVTKGTGHCMIIISTWEELRKTDLEPKVET